MPPFNFLLGGSLAVVLGLPLLSFAVYLLAHTTIALGDPDRTLRQTLRFAVLFAGLPALLTGGGVARLVAHRTAEKTAAASDPRRAWLPPLRAGALAMGAGGAALAYLVVVPLGGMPPTPSSWWPVALAGFAAGALAGLAIGALVGLRQRRFAARRASASLPA